MLGRDRPSKPSTDVRKAGRLDLLTDIATGVKHYYLDGIRLSDGDPIELAVDDGVWIRGTFCWSGHATRWPGMRIKLTRRPDAEDNGRGNAVISIPPEEALVRFAGQG